MYTDFNPTCSICGETMSCDDIIDPNDAPVCDECTKENESQNPHNLGVK